MRDTASRRRAMQLTRLTAGNRWRRLGWQLAWWSVYRLVPTPLHGVRRCLLRLFGARVGRGAFPYPRARIWAPWNLTMGDFSCIANDVDVYCVAPVTLGAGATVSQYSYLCTASHDFNVAGMPLVSAPIVIEDDAWVAADAYVGPGVCVGRGAVVAARAAAVRDVSPWTVVGGVPARQIAVRQVSSAAPAERADAR